MNKILLFVVLSTLCLMGCKEQQVESNDVKFGFFNDESYVWEKFQFPTNRTSGVQ